MDDLEEFSQRHVIVDGSKQFCLGVRTFGPRPYRKGDTVGLLIARS
jgi:hypothetical protein